MDASSFVGSVHGPAWLIAIVFTSNFGLLLYSSLVVLPLFALATTVVSGDPIRMIEEIAKEKGVEEEEYKQGIGG